FASPRPGKNLARTDPDENMDLQENQHFQRKEHRPAYVIVMTGACGQPDGYWGSQGRSIASTWKPRQLELTAGPDLIRAIARSFCRARNSAMGYLWKKH